MTTEAITPLRQRMIEDMNSRKLCVLAQPRKKSRKAPEKGKETSSSTEQRRRNAPQPVPSERWRSRISSAATGRRGVLPMPVTSASTS